MIRAVKKSNVTAKSAVRSFMGAEQSLEGMTGLLFPPNEQACQHNRPSHTSKLQAFGPAPAVLLALGDQCILSWMAFMLHNSERR